MQDNTEFDSQDVNQNKVFGILAYLGFLVLVPIFAAKDSPYARFHANQGLVLLIFEAAAYFMVAMCRLILFFVPFAGIFISALLGFCIFCISTVFIVLGIINACSNEAKKLPIIGEITILK